MVSLKKIIKSKIVCTLGPATESEEAIKDLIGAGMSVARLNFSHATHDKHAEIYNRIRKVDNNVAILCDIQGPKIRIGKMEEPVSLVPGNDIKITIHDCIGNEEKVSISHKGFLNDIEPGDYVYINDGIVKLVVKEVNQEEGYALCEVLLGGIISDRKGVNIPTGNLSTKNPTEKDIKDLKFIAMLNPEYVAASFVSNAREVQEVRKILDNEGSPNIKIVSKIERPVALDNFNEILEVSDAIMVARGDLGVEIPFDILPLKQKEIIKKSNIASKPVIVATQMLESMTNQSRPTRAEVSDVFNAIFDRSDAVMLSGETSVGKYPVKTVETMQRIVETAEKRIPFLDPDQVDSLEQEIYETVGHGVYTLSKEFTELNYRGKIVCITRGGKSARMVSKYRPSLPIIAITNDMTVARQMNLVWGVKPVFSDRLNLISNNPEEIIQNAMIFLHENDYIEQSEHVIVTIPSRNVPKRSALIGLYYVKDVLSNLE
ncbi:MAG: pyruvate kinase [Candidatus Lokiarchaeota archaeon]|nr:pyruvate kinase [Candidatus Lokiarchaeota archaeon]